MSRIRLNIGFDGRTFLNEAEWQTYRRRMAVRYIRRPRQSTCQVCGQPATPTNPLQSAHVIGFGLGVTWLSLTPDYLDSEANIVTAHRGLCNRAAELSLLGSMARLRATGVAELPGFLPSEILREWEAGDTKPVAEMHRRPKATAPH